MKLAFSTKHVLCASFIDLCNKVKEYGFDGVEIYDAKKEKAQHSDSIFHSSNTAGAKRKLVNRHIGISAIAYPNKINSALNISDANDYLELCAIAKSENLVVSLDDNESAENIVSALSPLVKKAEDLGVMILIETSGKYAKTQNVIDILNIFASGALGVAWNVRETYFVGKESTDTTIQVLGAYINYVLIGDKNNGVNCLIGDGELPVEEFVNALRSLNYDGYICALWNDDINDEDIVLTHFIRYMANVVKSSKSARPIYYNRSGTGTFPWKKYDILDMTFSQVLDTMVDYYPDQYAFKYTTLDYTRTYSQFRDDVDRTAAALISLGVKLMERSLRKSDRRN